MNRETEIGENRVRDVIKELKCYYRSLEYGPISGEEGHLLQMFMELLNAKNVLEIGTSMGVSSLWIALGLLKTKGKLIYGNAQDCIPLIKDKFDFIFLDSGKNRKTKA